MTRPSSFRTLCYLILTLFAGLGFFLGYSGLIKRVLEVRSTEIHILVSQDFLFPESFRTDLENKLMLRFHVEVASDPDHFLEKASGVDLLWGRTDWILRTQLRLTDFRQNSKVHELLTRTLSADFFDPEVTSSTVLPILWTLPVVHTKEGVHALTTAQLLKLPGKISWPFSGLEEFFPGLKIGSALPEGKVEAQWILAPISRSEHLSKSHVTLWFPEEKIRPLVVSLAFVENLRLSQSLKEKLVHAWLDPHALAKLARESNMALTHVQAEELLPPQQRASALRSIGLSHLARP